MLLKTFWKEKDDSTLKETDSRQRKDREKIATCDGKLKLLGIKAEKDLAVPAVRNAPANPGKHRLLFSSSDSRDSITELSALIFELLLLARIEASLVLVLATVYVLYLEPRSLDVNQLSQIEDPGIGARFLFWEVAQHPLKCPDRDPKNCDVQRKIGFGQALKRH